MQRWSRNLAALGLALVLGAVAWLMTAGPATAQCGSQASSCKNCHEVRREKPVNSDGTPWHQSHAFGDFCYLCHAGNNQSMDMETAHTGMVPPLSDIRAACQQCHPADLEARAQKYASLLGVEVGSGAATSATASGGGSAPAAQTSPAASVDSCNTIVLDDPNLVNYRQHYEQVVLGKKPVNWGNVILLVMIAGILFGGGGFVVTREKLVSVKFGDTRAADAEYPADVVEMLPQISGLKLGTRKALKSVLESKKAEKALDLLGTLISKEEQP